MYRIAYLRISFLVRNVVSCEFDFNFNFCLFLRTYTLFSAHHIVVQLFLREGGLLVSHCAFTERVRIDAEKLRSYHRIRDDLFLCLEFACGHDRGYIRTFSDPAQCFQLGYDFSEERERENSGIKDKGKPFWILLRFKYPYKTSRRIG